MQSQKQIRRAINELPEGFCYLHDYLPKIVVDLKYATADNFTGEVVEGYYANEAIMTIEAAKALQEVQGELNGLGLGLKIFDAYRPHKACQFFKRWAFNGSDDLALKQRFYPLIQKQDLMQGYIAEFSKHSRGSTIDLTIITLDFGEELDMGTEFDFFGEESYTMNPKMPKKVLYNRELLVKVMDRFGFNNYSKEWWHYELRNEPFARKPEDHFDFDIA